jgi:hypothetical protein
MDFNRIVARLEIALQAVGLAHLERRGAEVIKKRELIQRLG